MADDDQAEDLKSGCVNLLYLASTNQVQNDASILMNNPELPIFGKAQVSDNGDSVESAGSSHDPTPTRLLAKHSSICEEKEPVRICPKVNCPEKIVICLDVSQEMEKISFRSRAGDKFSPIKLAKRAIGIFVQTKHLLNDKHEFALLILREHANWLTEMTSNPDKIIAILDELDKCFPAENCDLSSVFEAVFDKVSLPVVNEPSLLPPPYVVRVLLLYGRSSCIPTLGSKEAQKMLMASPHFFLDIFYIHDPPTADNNCENIYDQLCELDKKGLFYILEVSRNPTKLYDSMAQLLPHPLQRPIQNDAAYKLEARPES